MFYSRGWRDHALSNGEFSRWHTASLPGTATVQIRRPDGRNFIALLNTHVSPMPSQFSPTPSLLLSEIDRALHEAAARVKAWPRLDVLP